jgi:putative membrane protein
MLLHVGLIAASVLAFWLVVGRPAPEIIPREIYNVSYDLGLAWTGVLYIAAGFVVALLAWLRAVPLRPGLAGAGVVVLLGLASELLGTHTGVPFGPYSYTTLLGPKILGLVPVVIPLSWFLMLYASLGVAARLRAGPVATAVAATLGLVAWDVLMDPAMSAVFPFWQWHVDGVFYGMPLVNWVGWTVTGLVMAAATLAVAGRWVPRLARQRVPVVLYGVNGLLPLALLLRDGLWGAAVLGTVAMAAYLALPLWAGRGDRGGSPAARGG